MEEPFLINPARRRRRRKNAPKRKRARMGGRRHRPVLYGSGKRWKRSPKSRSLLAGISINRPRRRHRRSYRRNPIGESLMIAGSNPMRRYRKHRRNPARRHYRRHYRRNPAMTGAMGGPLDIMKNVPYLVTGAVSITATTLGPGFIPGAATSPWMKYGAQAAIVVGGGLVVGKMFGRTHGSVWAVTGGAVIVADLLANFVLKPMGLFSDYDVEGYDLDAEDTGYYGEGEDLEAYPYDSEELSAFPGE